MRLLIALAIVTGSVLASVGLAVVTPSANAPAVFGGDAVYHNVVAPEDFLTIFPGEELLASEDDPTNVDDPEWRNLVAKLRQQGPESLTQDEWKTVVTVSWWALIMQQKTVKYHFSDRGPATQQQQDLIVAEKYEVPAWQEVPVPVIAGWGMRAAGSDTDSWDAMELMDLSDPNPDSPVVSTSWTRSASGWKCRTEDITEGYIWWEILSFGPPKTGPYAGTDSIDGRGAFEFGVPAADENGGTGMRLWIDVETLLPLQLEAIPSDPNPGGYSYFKFSGKFAILEVNGDVKLQAPATCVEEYQEPAGNEVSLDCGEISAGTPGIEEVEQFSKLMDAYKQTPPPNQATIEAILEQPPMPTPESQTLAALLPPDPSSGEGIRYGMNTNASVGCPGCGYWTNEYNLDKLKRLCGLSAESGVPVVTTSEDGLDVIMGGQVYLQMDYYATTPGATEAFLREVRQQVGDVVEDAASDLGDERYLSAHSYDARSLGQRTTHELVMRRRNIVVRLWGWEEEAETAGWLQFASQIDRNIEAAVQQ